MTKHSRNAPCPCGSGKKYKKCCLSNDQAEHVSEQLSEPISKAEVPVSAIDSATPDKLDVFWHAYEKADFNSKLEMIESLIDDPKLHDREIIFEVFNELSESAQSQKEHHQYRAMVDLLKANLYEQYEKNANYLLGPCINFLILERDYQALKPEFVEYGRFASQNLDLFFPRADQVAFHGQTETLRDGYRAGWNAVKNSEDLMPWAINEFAENGAQLELFMSMQDQPTPALDKDLIKRTEYFVSLDLDSFKYYFDILTGKQTGDWTPEMFDQPVHTLKADQKQELSEKVSWLTMEFFVYLAHHAKHPLTRVELMREELSKYLIKRLVGDLESRHSGKKSTHNPWARHILCPDRSTLDTYLSDLMGFMSGRYYRGVALFSSLPHWCDFLKHYSLVESETLDRALESIASLSPHLETIFEKRENDDYALQTLKSAWK
ncbi:hypothetical protein GF406_23610 [candidate division KSB1 bacterium]|nr:hypothetical protein [candidate division KSB1 bacterium]